LKEGLKDIDQQASRDVVQVTDKVDEGRYLQVNTDRLRNEELLTEAQKAEAREYAILLGMPESQIIFSDYTNTAFGDTFDVLRIGTDLLPSDTARQGTMYANSRVSWKSTLAHELEGHRAAALAGKTQENLLFEEVQASVRAARFAPGLTSTEIYFVKGCYCTIA
jgi:hypothetical protein